MGVTVLNFYQTIFFSIFKHMNFLLEIFSMHTYINRSYVKTTVLLISERPYLLMK